MSRRSVEELARDLLGKSLAELDRQERRVLERIRHRRVITQDAAELADDEMGFGDRLSDRVAAVGGSWGFIIAFGVVLFGWMLLNSQVLSRVGLAFDPYPFIFLNLMLSTLAAIQAPIIMMSQNRQSAKDRIAAEHDYEVNLRAELDIIRLHEKVDTLLLHLIDTGQLTGPELSPDAQADSLDDPPPGDTAPCDTPAPDGPVQPG